MLLAKVAAFVVVALSILLERPGFHRQWWYEVHLGNYGVPPSAEPTLRTMLSTFDAQHYLTIAEHGYRLGDPSLAHYPLWPMLVRLFAPLTGGDYLVSGLLLANLLSLAALVLLHDHVARTRDVRTANRTLLLLLAFPGSLFGCFPYSEALFLLLAVLVFALLGRGRPGLAALVAGLLPLTRSVGLLVVLPLLLHPGWRSHLHRLASPLPALAGFGLYLGLMHLSVGDAFAGFAIQSGYVAGSSVLDLLDPVAFFGALFASPLQPHGYLDSVVDRLFFAGFCAGALLLAIRWRRRPEELGWTVPMGLVPAMTVKLMAFTRYLGVVFPVFVAVAEALSGRRRHVAWALAAVMALVQVWFLARHVNHLWVG